MSKPKPVNEGPEERKLGGLAHEFLKDGEVANLDGDIKTGVKDLPAEESKKQETTPPAPPEGQPPAQPTTPTDPPPQPSAPTPTGDIDPALAKVLKEHKLEGRGIKTWDDLATSYRNIESKHDTTAQKLRVFETIIKGAPGGPVNPAAGMIPGMPTLPPGASVPPQAPYLPQHQSQDAPPSAPAPVVLTEEEINKLNDDFIDNPVSVLKTFMEKAGYLTKADLAKQNEERQAQARAAQQAEQYVDYITSALPDYEKYRPTMGLIFDMNPAYRQMPPQVGIPQLYNAAKLIVDSEGAPPQPTPAAPAGQPSNANAELANTNAGHATPGAEEQEINWDAMSREQAIAMVNKLSQNLTD